MHVFHINSIKVLTFSTHTAIFKPNFISQLEF